MASAFEKMTIGAMTARNRFVRAATAESLASPEGAPTSGLMGIYRELARGGVGVIITGYTYVTPEGKPSEGALGLYDDSHLDEFRALAESVHMSGAVIVLQLVYGGSKSKLAAGDSRRIASADAPCKGAVPNVEMLGASAIEHPGTHLVPREASADDLAVLAEAFGQAAQRARACGFDAVEVHVAHGYLLSQFLSRRFNVREDAYGGSLENRARLACECVASVRGAVGFGFPVLAKINSCDDLDDPQGLRGGLSEDESAQVAAWLVRAGADCIDVSGDWHTASSRDFGGEPFFADFGARLAQELDVPVLVTGGWRSLDVIEAHLGHDGIAGVAMGRPFICEPDLVNRWQSGDVAPSACTGCGSCAKRSGIPCASR